ncbi:hypothetical protein EC912_102152 [Luteibacter rhizovicinus]|uniref:Uncharacterized protein n=1 Tax=Luteibacter rhizovicinus TaxID=242606 RepID=A0A4R3YVG7_9GAMM|nr:hypothetical protein [Luteibacter rhizovicinus]TCV95808.1 hypothetical protein EC912_102152 [Luteibacter rhizovicinus]
MRYLAILLLAPWLLILGWAYWAYPKTLIRNATRRAFDVLALIAAAVASVQLAVIAFDSVEIKQVGDFGPESGGIWKQVIPALYGYGGFLAVLALAMLVRYYVWRRRP